MESGKLNFLEPSGPINACNGTALPLSLLPTKRHIFFCSNNMVFIKRGLKFKYQPDRLIVKQIPTNVAHYLSSITELFTPV